MKSNKLKTTIRPIDEKYIIIKGASKNTQGQGGRKVEYAFEVHPRGLPFGSTK